MAIGRTRLQQLPAAERQQSLRQFRAPFTGLTDVARNPLQILPGLELVAEMLGIADDDREQIVEVMGDAAGELPHHLHLLGLPKLLFGLLAAGQIMNDSDKDRLAVLLGLANRQIHRERRAVLAQADDLPADAD